MAGTILPPHLAPPAPQPDAATDHAFTLDPIRTDGPDALDPRGSQQIKEIILRKLELVRRNAFHQVTIAQAPDLFATSAADHAQPDPIPNDAIPVAATLVFHFTDDSGSDTLEIRLPNTLKLNSPTHEAAILAWLSKSCLKAAKKFARLALILFVATMAACGPALDPLSRELPSGFLRLIHP